ncbi:putative hydrolase YxeP [Roseovarius albus]|uniref:Putative hydrolase YxeP n=1 Tax=Roseovarius albus TaxID=1247867 RepID=A0A1X6Z663_9RHOB|nr:amidohydrolase [Roseovarius albus]SLN41287.1 putative hydrolase YxeP [Roseovarius albus]
MRELTADQIEQMTNLRQTLHRKPEISGQERETARLIEAELRKTGADRIITGLGGFGVAAEFIGADEGPTVLIRCELDALPIQEISNLPYRSEVPGTAHLCGHDGHMSIVMAVALAFGQQPPAKGRVILMFQPAEETGVGAAAVVSDSKYGEIKPDCAFAIHNVPGWPLGDIRVVDGVANCASRGMRLTLSGKTSHAAAPQDGLSPGPAMAQLMQQLAQLGAGGPLDQDFAMSTLTHVRLGEATFGISPGEGELLVTLRSVTDAKMDALVDAAQDCVAKLSGDLTTNISWHDVFPASVNATEAAELVHAGAARQGLQSTTMSRPMQWSEDFGHFGKNGTEAAMIFLGSGPDQPQLHNPDYDFPDRLIPLGADLLLGIVRQIID